MVDYTNSERKLPVETKGTVTIIREETPIITVKEKRGIFYNVINSALYGTGALIGAIGATGELTPKGILIAIITACGVGVIKFSSYWASQEKEYNQYLFNLV